MTRAALFKAKHSIPSKVPIQVRFLIQKLKEAPPVQNSQSKMAAGNITSKTAKPIVCTAPVVYL